MAKISEILKAMRKCFTYLASTGEGIMLSGDPNAPKTIQGKN